MIEWVATSLDQTLDLGCRLGQLAVAGDVIALDGELGAGKTQFVRGLAQGMGLDAAHVSSPTFVILHEYTPEPPEGPEDEQHSNLLDNASQRPVLVHIDAYRLTGPDDLASVGFDDELRDGAVVAVEWASRLMDLPGGAPGAGVLGDDRLHVRIEHGGNDTRRFTLTPHGRWTQALPTLVLPTDTTTP